MARVEIYATPICPYCMRAKALLQRKGVGFVDIDVLTDRAKRAEMVERSGGRTTVPQIFINGEHIGGSDELVELEEMGMLDLKLGIRS